MLCYFECMYLGECPNNCCSCVSERIENNDYKSICSGCVNVDEKCSFCSFMIEQLYIK